MFILYTVLGTIGTIAFILIIVGYLSPRITTMSRSININASASKVFPYLNNLQSFVNNWSPWTEKDPNMEQKFNQLDSGVGAEYSWKGEPKKVGEGYMKIIESSQNKEVKTEVHFKGRGMAHVNWTIKEIDDNQIKVTWGFQSDNGTNPIARLFGRMIEKFLGPDYENGLNKLKKVVEA